MKKIILIILILVSSVFMVPSMILVGDVSKHISNKSILSNGIETEAVVLIGTASSNLIINDIHYYSIEYCFFDEEGNRHVGKTSDTYTLTEIRDIENDGFITIKYDAETFESIEATYSFEDVSANLQILIVFTIVDVLLWGGVVLTIVAMVKDKQLLKHGKEFLATFVSSYSIGSVNGKQVFRIAYFWKNQDGMHVEGKSRNLFTEDEVSIFQTAKEFRIKAIGKKSVVVSTPAELMAQHSLNTLEPQQEYCKCNYCGAIYSKELVKCSECGALKEKMD